MVEHNQSESESSPEKTDDDIEQFESLEDLGLELVDNLPVPDGETDDAAPSIDEFQISTESTEETTPTLDDLGIAITSEEHHAESSSTDEWFLQQFGQTLGPFPYERLVELAEEGSLNGDDQICRGENGPWIEAGSIEGLVPEEDDFELGASVEIKEDTEPENTFEVVGGVSNRLLEKGPSVASHEEANAKEDTEGLEDLIDGEEFDEPIDFESLPDAEPEVAPQPKPKPRKKPKKAAVDDIIDDVLNDPDPPAPVETGTIPTSPPMPANPVPPPVSPSPMPTPVPSTPVASDTPTPPSKPADYNQTPAGFQSPTPTPAAYRPPPPPKKKSSGGSFLSGIGNPFSGLSMPSASIDPKTVGALGAVIVIVLGIYIYPMLGGTNDQKIYDRFNEIHASIESGQVSNAKELIAEVEATITALEKAGAGATKPAKQNLLSAGKFCLIPLLEDGSKEALTTRFDAHMKIVKAKLTPQ